MTITMYDIVSDTIREATQQDWDDVQKFIQSIGQAHSKMLESDKRGDEMNFRLATFVNPMRDDGLFVAEDKPIEPYEGCARFDGSPVYPACPKTKWLIGHQLGHVFAQEIVRRWNLCQDRNL